MYTYPFACIRTVAAGAVLVAALGRCGALAAGPVRTGYLHGVVTPHRGASRPAPHLSFPCGAPNDGLVVTCRLAGRGFYPYERVAIAYTVEIGMPGGRHTMVYRRNATTDSGGAFKRPALWFHVDPRVLAYKVNVAVTGQRGDHAAITAAGTP